MLFKLSVLAVLSALTASIRFNVDYYATLSIPETASAEEIRKAYLSAALKCHPDKVPPGAKEDASKKFRDIFEAYTILSEPNDRSTYDSFRNQGPNQGEDKQAAHHEETRRIRVRVVKPNPDGWDPNRDFEAESKALRMRMKAVHRGK